MYKRQVKFTPAGGSVSLRVVEHASRVEGTSDYEFVFADTGCGMAPEFLAHVFEPFAREHDSRTESVEGTGLGQMCIRDRYWPDRRCTPAPCAPWRWSRRGRTARRS